MVSERIVTHGDSAAITDVADLSGREIVVRRSSAFWETLEALHRDHPDFTLSPAPEELNTEQILHRVARGTYDATVADDILIEEVQAYQSDLRADLVIAGNRAIGWGVRRDNPELLAAVSNFVTWSAGTALLNRNPWNSSQLRSSVDPGVCFGLRRNSNCSSVSTHSAITFRLMLWLIAAGAAVAQVHRADLRIDGLT